MNTSEPRAAFRMTQEDAANLSAIHGTMGQPTRPIATTSACIRAALRAAGFLARQGHLKATLAEYRSDLAGRSDRI